MALSPVAGAETIDFNPSNPNGLLALDPGQGAFSVTGGTGALYDNFTNTNSGTRLNGDIIVNITGFDGGVDGPVNASPGYELFAVISLTGTGTTAGTTFTASSGAFNIQLYGVNTNQDYFNQTTNPGKGYKAGTSGTNTCTGGPSPTCDITQGLVGFADPAHSSTVVAVPSAHIGTTQTSLSVTDLVNNGVTGNNEFQIGDRGTNEFGGNLVEPNGKVGDSTGGGACIDTTTISVNGAPSFTGSQANCILLASGTGTTSSLILNGTADTVTFGLDASITPASYAAGASGFFSTDTTDSPILLDIFSDGSPENEITGDSTNPPCGNSGTTGAKCYTANAGDAVSWDLPDAVPEPGSLALLGTAFAGFIAARRRKRKAA